MLHVGQESHLQFLSYNGLPYLFQIPLDDVQGIRVTDFQEFLNIREGFYYNAMKELVLTKIQYLRVFVSLSRLVLLLQRDERTSLDKDTKTLRYCLVLGFT